MKRILSLLLALLLLVNLATPAMAAEGDNNQITLSVDKTDIKVGDMVYVTVGGDSAYTAMSTISMKLFYDGAAFELDRTASTAGEENDFFEVGKAQTDKNTGKNYVTVSFMDLDGETDVAIGEYATVAFLAKAEADGAVFSLGSIKVADDTLAQVTYLVKAPEAVTVPVASGTPAAPTTYTVTLPTGEGFTAASEQSTTVEAGQTFTFTVTAAEGYEGTPVVKVGDTVIEAVNGSYTITVNADVNNITVEGFAKIQEKVQIPNGAPFTEIYTDKGNALKIDPMGDLAVNSYADVPYYRVTIPVGAEIAYVAHPESEKPIMEKGYSCAFYWDLEKEYGEYPDINWTKADDGGIFELPLTMEDIHTVADKSGKITGAVGVYNEDPWEPICLFSFVYDYTTYKVTMPKNPVGYTIDYTGSTKVVEGEPFAFTVTAAEGYVGTPVVKANGTEIEAVDGTYTITVTEDVTITVEGLEMKTYTVTLPTSLAYTAASQQSATVAHGETYTFTVTANEGYAGTPVVKVNGTEIEAVDGSYTITVTGNVAVEIRGIELVYEGYGVRASQDRTITAGEEAEVAITVEADEATVYNAYDLTVTYDADVVNYKSFTAAEESDELTVTVDEGTIRIQGYGADKTVGTAPVTLKFSGKALGAADVTIQTAKVDIGAHAIESDAPDAALLKDSTVVTVTGYNVELDDGLRADSTVAQNGVDYIFHPTDSDNYTYVVTYTVGGQTYTAKNNADGSYTIPGEHITDNIVLNATMTPKSYSVTITGQDVSGEKTAIYNTAYTFTVDKQSGYSYTVSVLIGNETYIPDVSGNTYTIAGTDITGNITITVTKTKIEEDKTVTVNKPGWVTGSATATKGQSYSFTVPKDEGYTYGDLKVTVGGTDITAKLTVSGNSYTIPAAQVTGDINISITRTADMDVDVVHYLTLNNKKVMYLVTASGKYPSGSIAKFDGQSMYWSETYKAYAWLIISEDIEQNVLKDAKEKISIAQGTAAGNINYSGDVNGTGIIDINDAQLTYDMYNAKYDSFTDVSMLKFLNADVNGDALLDVKDASAVVVAIK